MLDSAVRMVLNAEEREPEVPMEVEETEAGYAKKEETLKIPCSSRTSFIEKFSKETNQTKIPNYSSSNSISSNNIFGNPDFSRQPIEMESNGLSSIRISIKDNPSLCKSEASSEITVDLTKVK